MIFAVLGTPTEGDSDFVTDDKALDYLKSFSVKKRTDFKDIFPAGSKEAIDFMDRTIQFNPRSRVTVDEGLSHPLFEAIRDKSKEIVASGSIKLDFEKEGELEEKRLRELFVSEMMQYHKA